MKKCFVFIGLAGSGKTTLVGSLYKKLEQERKSVAVVNLDPSVHTTPFPTVFDIAKIFSTKRLIETLDTGANGSVNTALLLLAQKLVSGRETRFSECDYLLVDTPGQIETFLWSSAAEILLLHLSSSFALRLCFVIDSVPLQRTDTAFSQRLRVAVDLYSWSVQKRFDAPVAKVYNKIDLCDTNFAFALSSKKRKDEELSHFERQVLYLLESVEQSEELLVSAKTGKGLVDVLRLVCTKLDRKTPMVSFEQSQSEEWDELAELEKLLK